MMDRAEMEALFRRARERNRIQDLPGLGKLVRSGAEYRGACPLCADGSRKGGKPFALYPDRQTFRCWGDCGARGDLVDLEHALRSKPGESLVDTARRLAGDAPETDEQRKTREAQRVRSAAALEAGEAWKAEIAARLWREAGPAAGTPVETYLRARGIGGAVLERALGQLRFHPAAYYAGGDANAVRMPAMIGLVTLGSGATGGVHATYLSPTGRSKTGRRPAKKMWGPQGVARGEGEDRVLRPGGIWLSRPDDAGRLVVAEGIENALSAAILMGGVEAGFGRFAAAGSLNRLQGGERLDQERRVNAQAPEGDPGRPPFLWPEPPGAPWGEVLVAVDRDMKPVRVRGFVTARSGRVRDCHFVRDAEARAALCARLAAAAWRASLAPDSKTTVRAIQPGRGRDFNDELMTRLAGASA